MANALEVEMSQFFGHQYNEAWKFGGDEIAKLYSPPRSPCGETGRSIVFSPMKSLRGSSKVSRHLQGQGSDSTTMHDLVVVPIGDRSALATMTWKMLRADGSPIREWRQSYNVVRLAEGWRILVSTFHLGS